MPEPRAGILTIGAMPVSTPRLKPMALMQVLAPLLAVLLAILLALLAAWALSMPAPAQVKDAKISVCHGVGGMFAASGTIIFTNER